MFAKRHIFVNNYNSGDRYW